MYQETKRLLEGSTPRAARYIYRRVELWNYLATTRSSERNCGAVERRCGVVERSLNYDEREWNNGMQWNVEWE